MTARVKELTDRATAPPRGSEATSPARDLLALLDAFARLDYPKPALLAAARLDERTLEDPDARVPCSTLGVIVGAAQGICPRPNLALAVAEATPMGAFPLLDYLVLSSDTVGDGYRQLARYFRLISPTPMEVFEAEEPIRVVLSGAHPFAAEFTLSLGILHFRREVKGRFAPDSLSFAHRPDDPAAFERTLRVPVRCEAGWNGVSYPRAVWSLPLPRRDRVLRSLLEKQAAESERAHSASGGLVGEVTRLLLARVEGGDVRIESVAKSLATTPRTLQRRLALEGTSFQTLVEGARRAAAEGYLTGSALSAGEIAYLLGYSEPAAFHRAFRRWNGVTPREFREHAANPTGR